MSFSTFREHNLVQLFSWFGTVLDAEIIFNDKGSKGYGFVTMASMEEADLVLTKLHHSVIDNRVVQINMAKPKKQVRVSGDSTASPSNLVCAEVRLAQAQLDVKRLKEEALCSKNM